MQFILQLVRIWVSKYHNYFSHYKNKIHFLTKTIITNFKLICSSMIIVLLISWILYPFIHVTFVFKTINKKIYIFFKRTNIFLFFFFWKPVKVNCKRFQTLHKVDSKRVQTLYKGCTNMGQSDGIQCQYGSIINQYTYSCT